MATRQEATGMRSLDFSGWVRKNLPDSKTGYMASDLDFLLYNYRTRKVALVEVKQYNKQIASWQMRMLSFLENCIKDGKPEGWEFVGLFIIRFEVTGFSDGRVFVNGDESSEEEIKKILSF